MRLKPDARDRLLTEFATRLNAGAIVMYEADPETKPLQLPLVSVLFQSPAFLAVVDGRALAREIQPVPIATTGEAGWAEFVTAAGAVLLTTRVRAQDDPKADAGDVLVDRTDFHRGGLCTLTRVTLTLPLQA